MSWYVVSYDLRRETSSYDWEHLYEVLKGSVDYCWPLDSIWIIETPRPPSEVIDILYGVGVLDDNDGIIVLEITGVGDFRRVADQQVADWLNSKLSRR